MTHKQRWLHNGWRQPDTPRSLSCKIKTLTPVKAPAARPDNKCRTEVVFSLVIFFPLKVTVHTHCGEFGSRCTGTGGSSFVPVQIQPDFLLSHLLEEINTYFLKFCEAPGGRRRRGREEGRKAAMQILINGGFDFSPQCKKDGLHHRRSKTLSL